ncbi:MAG: hypothetical protein ABI690_27315 [Chloroflexota bacterium]
MITLYSSGGSGKIISSGIEQLSNDDLDILIFNTNQLLLARGKIEAVGLLTTLDFKIYDGTNDFGDDFCVLDARVPLSQYEYLRSLIADLESLTKYTEIFENIASIINEIIPYDYYIRFITCTLDPSIPPDNWRSDLSNTITALSSNQALFTFQNSAKLIHDGLNFRSKTEIKIYDGLVKRGLLVLPLPVAVMGKPRAYKEPDFVVCYNGKMGILEIHGDKWHPPETAAKEHERRREFTKLGISVYEIFGADRCWNDPNGVIDEFMASFKP